MTTTYFFKESVYISYQTNQPSSKRPPSLRARHRAAEHPGFGHEVLDELEERSEGHRRRLAVDAFLDDADFDELVQASWKIRFTI